jgi:hypothetical protein
MVSVTNALDPYITYIDSEFNTVNDTNNNPIVCDDAGNANLCWGESSTLTSSFIDRTAGQRIGGFAADAMISLPLGNFQLNSDMNFNFVNFLMSSYRQTTFGDYLLAFHIATAGN